MIKLYILDDDACICRDITDSISRQIIIENYDMEIDFSGTSPEELLEHLKAGESRRNLYFLDVELKHETYDGFLLGQAIRSLDPNGTIVYITSFKDLAYKTFQYHIEAFDYIVKDTADKLSRSISECLRSFAARLLAENKDPVACYTIKSGDTIHHVPIDDIYYFETSCRPHYVILYGRHQRIEFLGNLSDMEQELSEHFVRIHRSYLVALNKIESINLKKRELTVAGQICPISRKEKSELLKRIS